MSKPKIYVFIAAAHNDGFSGPLFQGVAIAEDGEYLTSHISSSEDFFRHDMGLTSGMKHDAYRAHYPDGYDLVDGYPPTAQGQVLAARSD